MADLANSSIQNVIRRTPEEKLWKAVLSQGVYEACSEKYNALPLTFGEYRSAIEWADLSNRDFCMVCHLAGYDPKYIYRKIKNKLRKRNGT
tara:strand:- start:475 stop:747 length:273 start_codon:yes stop_codon:yes gene_type:complete